MTHYCLSGVLLALCTPSFGCWPLVFVAFVPLLYALEDEFQSGQATYGRVFVKAFVTGLFFTVSYYFWIAHLNVLAVPPAASLFACLYGLFAMGVLLGLEAGLKGSLLSLWVACLWVSLEVLGSDLFLPFPSGAIGYSVWSFPVLIQIADITGVFGVSFWIIIINVLIVRWMRDGFRANVPWTMVVLTITFFLVGYGISKYSCQAGVPGTGSSIALNLVHTAVTTEYKEDPDLREKTFGLLKTKTRESIDTRSDPPDLVIWPETSVPVFLRSIREKEFIEGLLDLAKEAETSIFLGALSFTREDDGKLGRFNAAFLVPPKGYVAQEYHKIILTPFRETNPFESMLPKKLREKWRSRLDAGKELGLMELDTKDKFGVFICYEVFFPDFVRRLVGKGAGFLVNITNDEPAFGHLTRAYRIPLPPVVYRAVETRRYLARCANYGTSMIVSPKGEIIQSTPLGSTGVLSSKIVPMYDQTFLVRYGFVFAKTLFFLSIIWAMILIWRRRILVQRS
ncbi:MAG: apolipoprotein N-acyltransferase [Desulfobacteraceae bacterium]|nr:apolipoprotein N-acyltransferase [Desulfobacteraceae bacterium]